MKKVKNIANFSGGMNRSDTIKVMPQKGRIISLPRDEGRGALLPGKRRSKTGKVYWETRFNRSDAGGSKV
jgi:hypothetical protein